MRILVHDHAGHPFQAQLSRLLAARGHDVLHVHASAFASAKGALSRRPGDPPTLAFDSVAHRQPFAKYSYGHRLAQELEYGLKLGRLAGRFRPDVVISCNTPLLSQLLLTAWARRHRVGAVSWVQDLYSAAAIAVLQPLPALVRRPLSSLVELLEAWPLRHSDAVVAISGRFRGAFDRWRVDPERVEVIANWPVVEELAVAPRDNPWARERGLTGRFVFLYTGILGLKHDWRVLARLATQWRDDPEVAVVVVAEGPGADALREHAAATDLGTLVCLPFQDYARYPEVLGSGDVLVALLTAESAAYSVPSKVLSYLCADRPILAVMPTDNDAAAAITTAGAGVVGGLDDDAGLAAAARWLRDDPAAREAFGAAARRHAETAFDPAGIAERFEAVLLRAAGRRPALPAPSPA